MKNDTEKKKKKRKINKTVPPQAKILDTPLELDPGRCIACNKICLFIPIKIVVYFGFGIKINQTEQTCTSWSLKTAKNFGYQLGKQTMKTILHPFSS